MLRRCFYGFQDGKDGKTLLLLRGSGRTHRALKAPHLQVGAYHVLGQAETQDVSILNFGFDLSTTSFFTEPHQRQIKRWLPGGE